VKKEIGIGSSIEDGGNSSRCRKWIGVDQKIDGRAEFQSGPKLIPFLVFTKFLTKKPMPILHINSLNINCAYPSIIRPAQQFS
jgi:hypothetical protein